MIEVVEKGSFSRAAESLCVSQSTVSRRIQFLEEQYGVALVDRSGPRIVPTEVGSEVLEKARRILELEGEIEERVRIAGFDRPVGFACTPEFGILRLPEVLHGFLAATSRRPPRLRLEFGTPEQIALGVARGAYDLAVVEHCLGFEAVGCDRIPLGGDEVVFASHPGLGVPVGTLAVEDLLSQILLVPAEAQCCRALLEANLAGAGRRIDEFRGVVVFDDLVALRESVLRGDGVAFLPSDLVTSFDGALRTHRVKGFEHRRLRTLLLPGSKPPSAAAAALREHIVKTLTAGNGG
ncbi:LysR family transcriptional regulator [Deferrisoma palaeochoriense]